MAQEEQRTVEEEIKAIKQRLSKMDTAAAEGQEKKQRRTMVNAKRRNAIGLGKEGKKNGNHEEEDKEQATTREMIAEFRTHLSDNPPPDWTMDEHDRKSQRRREIRSNLQQTRHFLRQHPEHNVITRADKISKLDAEVQDTVQVLVDRGFPSDATCGKHSSQGRRRTAGGGAGSASSSSQQRRHQQHQHQATYVEDEDDDETYGNSPSRRCSRRHRHSQQRGTSGDGDDDDDDVFEGPMVDQEYWLQLQLEGRLGGTSYHHGSVANLNASHRTTRHQHRPLSQHDATCGANKTSESTSTSSAIGKSVVMTYDDILHNVEQDIQRESAYRASTSGHCATATTATAGSGGSEGATSGKATAASSTSGGPKSNNTIGNAQSKYLRGLLQDELGFLRSRGNESRSGALWFGATDTTTNTNSRTRQRKPATTPSAPRSPVFGGFVSETTTATATAKKKKKQYSTVAVKHDPSDVTRATMSDLCRHRQPASILLPPLLPKEQQQYTYAAPKATIANGNNNNGGHQASSFNDTAIASNSINATAGSSTTAPSSRHYQQQQQRQQDQVVSSAASYDPDYYGGDGTGHTSPHRVHAIPEPSAHLARGFADTSASEREQWRRRMMKESHEHARAMRARKEEREALWKEQQLAAKTKGASGAGDNNIGGCGSLKVSSSFTANSFGSPPSPSQASKSNNNHHISSGNTGGAASAFNYHGPNHQGATKSIPPPDSRRIQQLLRGVFVKGGDVGSFTRASAMEAKNGLMRHDERTTLRARLGGSATGR